MELICWKRKLADVLKVSQHSQLRASILSSVPFCTFYTLIIFDFQHVFSNFFLFTVCWQVPRLSILPFPAGSFNKGQYYDGCYKSWYIRLKVLALGWGWHGVNRALAFQTQGPEVESGKHIECWGYAGTYLQPQEDSQRRWRQENPQGSLAIWASRLVSCGPKKDAVVKEGDDT